MLLRTDEHKAIFETTRQFVEQQINPRTAAWEREGIWPAHEIMAKLGALGLLGINKPPEFGGQGLDYSYHLEFARALGHCNIGAVPVAIGVQTDMATPALARFGSDELRREYLAPALSGEMVASIAVSEASAGSDVAGIKTTARKVSGDYVINGSKMWITNGTQADWACMLCNTEGLEGPHKNKSLLIVPLDAKGVDRSQKLDKLGLHASDTAMIFLDEVKVPQRNLIGEEGKGFTYQMQQFQEERLFTAAFAVPALDRVLADTVSYTRERKIFGGSVLDKQYVYFRLAELATELEALRSLMDRAAAQLVAGEDATLLVSMVKLKFGRLAREVPDACLQFWGGQGFMRESSPAQFYRDLRAAPIGGGADEVMLEIIAKRLGYRDK
jgi:citronellyl-CoA dehydrogenase